MPILDFPGSPGDNDRYTENGIEYYYDASVGAWLLVVPSIVANTLNTQVIFNDDGKANGSNGLIFDKSANTLFANMVSVSENVSATYFIGDGSYLTGVSSGGEAFDKANAANILAEAAIIQANVVWDSANSNYTYAANNVMLVANTAYDAANTTYTFAANNVMLVANSAWDKANTANLTADLADVQSQAAFDQANTVWDSANSNYTFAANNVMLVANTAYDKANAANLLAYAALPQSGGTVDGDLIITGNVTVSGNTTYTNTETLLIGDNIIELNSDLPSDVAPSEDAGIQINRGSADANVSVQWNEGVDEWQFTNDATTFYAIPTNTAVETAQTKGEAAHLAANTAYTFAANNAMLAANTAFDTANATYTYAANNVMLVANTAYDKANAANITADVADVQSQAAFDQANTVWDSANSNYTFAANTVMLVANSAWDKANTANITADLADAQSQAAFDQANVVWDSANSNYTFAANTVRLIANTAYDTANATYTYAANNVMLVANSAWDKANTANLTADLADAQSQAAFDQANTVWDSANSNYTFAANTVRLIANTAYDTANSNYTYAANDVMLAANAAFAQANAANLIPVGNTIASNSYYTNRASRRGINFLEGTGITINVDDDPTLNLSNITITSTGGDTTIAEAAFERANVVNAGNSGAAVGYSQRASQKVLNFVEGTDIVINVDQDDALETVNIKITSTATEGASASDAFNKANLAYTFAANDAMLAANSAYGEANVTMNVGNTTAGTFTPRSKRRAINFLEGSGITITIDDDAVLNTANVTITSTGGDTTIAEAAFDQANTVWDSANSNYTFSANTVRLIANTAYDAANSNYTYAANNVMLVANTAYDKANSANITADIADTQSQAAFDQANTVWDSANSYYTFAANNVMLVANSAYDKANSANITADNADAQSQAAFDQANTVWDSANSNYTFAANTVMLVANTAYDTANSTYTYASNNVMLVANSAYDKANAANITADVADVQSQAAFDQANTVWDSANSNYTFAANNVMLVANTAYDKANAANLLAFAALPQSGGTVDGDLIITGNVTISGNTTFANTETLLVGDNIIELNNDLPHTVAPSEDAGIQINRGSADANVSLLWNEGIDEWQFTNDATTFYAIPTNTAVETAQTKGEAAHETANTTYTYAANNVMLVANSAYDKANSANITADVADAQSQAAFDQANTVWDSANSNYTFAANTVRLIANTAYDAANSNYTYAANNVMLVANSAYDKANSANITADTADAQSQAAFDQANVVWDSANSNYTFAANTVMLVANTAYDTANTTYTYAANDVMLVANSAYDKANSANITADNADVQSQAAFDQANVVWDSANSNYTFAANTVRLIANTAYDTANANYTYAANDVMLVANSAYGEANVFNIGNSGAAVGFSIRSSTKKSLNFVEGTDIVINVDDDPVFNTVNITITSTATEGASASDAFNKANLAYTYAANTAMLAANSAYGEANVTMNVGITTGGTYTPTSKRRAINFIEGTGITIGVVDDAVLNTANVTITSTGGDTTIAEAAFDQANTVWDSANSNYTFAANTVRLIANTAYDAANSNYTYAANNVMLVANTAYDKANAANITADVADAQSQAAFDQANTVWDSANSNYTFAANTVRLIANTAYDAANSNYTYAANNVMLVANTAYANANAALQTFIDTDRLGFRDRTETTLGYNDSTYTFTVTDAGGGWGYYRQGLLREISGNKSVVLGSPPATGKYYIYIDADDGTLSSSTSEWTLTDDKIPVATIDWNESNTPKYWLADERHSVALDRAMQYYLHAVMGAKLLSPPTLADYITDSDDDDDKSFSISASTILDQDYLHNNASVSDPNGVDDAYVIWYRTASDTWTWEYSNVPFKYTGAGYIEWDNAGTMTAGINGKWYNTYLVVTGVEGDARYVIVPGRGQFDTLAEARSESIQDFTWENFDIDEAVVAYRLIWKTLAGYTSSGKAVLEEDPTAIEISTVTNASSGAGVDHNTLSNLQGGTVDEYYHLTQAEYTALPLGYDKANSANVLAEAAIIQANTVWDSANSNYTYAANNVMLVANSAYDKANSANITADNADTQSQAAFDQANVVWNSANSNYTFAANTVRLIANTAYDAANSNYTYAANNVMLVANSAYDKANSANITADLADAQSQAAFDQANTVWDSANSNYTFAANTVRLIANTAYDKANSANLLAYAALPQSGGTISGDLIITGNVTISGNTTYANTETLLVGDNIIELNSDLPHTVAPSEDAGIQVNRGNADANVSILWDETIDEWKFTNDASTFYSIPTNTAVIAAQTKGEAAHETANATYTYAANNVMLVANSAYDKANSANITADIADTQSQAAFNQANTVWDSANSNYTFAANTVRLIANTAYDAANSNYTYAANNVMLVANSAWDKANTANTTADLADTQSQAAFDQANTVWDSANSNYTFAANTVRLIANSAYGAANISMNVGITTGGTYTPTSKRSAINFIEGTGITITIDDDADLNTANVTITSTGGDTTIAEAAFDQANTVWDSANSNYTFAANTVRLIANTAYDAANSNYTYAANNVMLVANSAWDKANTANTTADLADAQSQASFDQANVVWDSANSNYTFAANNVMLVANSAYGAANISMNVGITTGGTYTPTSKRSAINFIEGTGITITIDDDADLNTANVTITSTGGDTTIAEAAFDQANTVWDSANSNYTYAANDVMLVANSAYAAANAAGGTAASEAFDKANTANVLPVGNTISSNGYYAVRATRRGVNFLEGSNITITIDDDADLSVANVTIASAGGGGGATTSDTAPGSPSDGDLWWNSTNGKLYIYYDDGDTSQWVESSPGAVIANGAMDVAIYAADLANTTCTSVWTYTANNIMANANSYSKSISIVEPGISNVTLFYSNSTVNITRIAAVIVGSTSVAYNIRFSDDRSDTTPTNVNSVGWLCSSTTTGQILDKGFENQIPADNWVWLYVTNISGSPTEFHLTVDLQDQT